MKRYLIFLFILSGMALGGCDSDQDYLIRIETKYGEMVGILYDDTPIHKKNFIELAQSGRFDSTEFQRVMKGFMIQGGDVFTKENLPPQEWPTLDQEIRINHIHKRGAIGAPRQPDPVNPRKESNGSQFYIVDGRDYTELEVTTDMQELQKAILKYMELGSQAQLRSEYSRLYEEGKFDSLTALVVSKREEIESFLNVNLSKDYTKQQINDYTTMGGSAHLDREYTVFGEILSGFEVIDQIASEAVNSNNRPFDPVYMKVSAEKVSRKKIQKDYNYTYPDGN